MGLRTKTSRVDDVAYAVARAINDTRRALVSTNAHADVTPELVSGDWRNPTVTAAAVSAANATNAATLLTLCKDIRAILALHFGDSCAHKLADPASIAAEPTATASCITSLNSWKAAYNTHRASTTYHYNADGTNAVAADDATDEATAITLANEIKADLNAHILLALGGHSVRIPGVH